MLKWGIFGGSLNDSVQQFCAGILMQLFVVGLATSVAG